MADAEWHRAYYQRNKEKLKAKSQAHYRSAGQHLHRLRKYGISPSAFKALFDYQGNVCGCCKQADPGPKGWVVDHNHSTGEVRGVLCFRCNVVLGSMGDTLESVVELAGRMENYLATADVRMKVASAEEDVER